VHNSNAVWLGWIDTYALLSKLLRILGCFDYAVTLRLRAESVSSVSIKFADEELGRGGDFLPYVHTHSPAHVADSDEAIGDVWRIGHLDGFRGVSDLVKSTVQVRCGFDVHDSRHWNVNGVDVCVIEALSTCTG
jgi:hypothetical protein